MMPPLITVGSRSPASSSAATDRKSTRLNSSHSQISYAVFCLKKKKKDKTARNSAARARTHVDPRNTHKSYAAVTTQHLRSHAPQTLSTIRRNEPRRYAWAPD